MKGERPKAKAQGKHLRNSCGSESRKGKRKPSVEPSTKTWKEDMRDQVREKGETEESREEAGIGEAAVRRNREEKERKNRRLSSWKRKGSGRKETNRKWKMLEVKTESKHLWNSCGSEAGKSEKKRTVEPSTRTWKEDTRNQVGEKGETEESREETGTGEAAVRQNQEEKERKNRG